MYSNIEWVKSAVYAAIQSPDQPNQAKIAEICRLTYIEDARKEIERMIDRRLQSPHTYKSLEVLHTLVLMQNCLHEASSDFVTFCVDKTQLVIALKRYARRVTPDESSALVRSRADTLSGILANTVRLTEQRLLISTTKASATAPPVLSKTIPLPPPQLSSSTAQKAASPYSQSKCLPTPNPTPPKAPQKLRPDAAVKVQGKVPGSKHEVIPPSSVLLWKKEDVAAMSFKSGQEGVDGVSGALDDLLDSTSSFKSPNDLVQALTCVHHCLYWGSAPFVARCRQKMKVFHTLRKHSIAQVRGHADAIVSHLNENSRLQEERRSRASLIPPAINAYKKSNPDELLDELSGQISVLEPVTDISKYVIQIETRHFAGGAFSDVYKGIYRTSQGKETVAIKFLRTLSKVPAGRLQKRLNRELHVWRKLLHRNISPFYGIIVNEGIVGMVSPFYENGNVLEYVKNNQSINPLEMLQGIADGVAYLHAQGIVHGDIKCGNVMVDHKGVPKLIDFGVAQVINAYAKTTGYTTTNLASSLRWSAPELLIADSPVSSKSEKSDVYAFASLCIEIMTLNAPYHPKNDNQVLRLVLIDNAIPSRPALDDKWSPCDELWDFLVTCWARQPKDRPNIVAVRRKLAEFYDGVAGR